jgi:hypothetical protein
MEANNIARKMYSINKEVFRPLANTILFDLQDNKLGEDRKMLMAIHDGTEILYEKLVKNGSARGSNRTLDKIRDRVQQKYPNKDLTTIFIYPSSDIYSSNVGDYLELKGLGHLSNKYLLAVQKKQEIERNEKEDRYPEYFQLKKGDSYNIYIPTRGAKNDANSYIPFTYNGLDVDLLRYEFTTDTTIKYVDYDKIKQEFKNQNIIPVTPQETATSKPTTHEDYLANLLKRIAEYKESRNTENRNRLQAQLTAYGRQAQIQARDGNTSLIPEMFLANSVLPYSKRKLMYAFFIDDAPDDDSYYVPSDKLKKPVWDFIPKSLIKPFRQSKVNFKMNPNDSKLTDIMSHAVGRDDLRPVMGGINIDDSGATATDAHVLLHVAGKKDGKFEDGTYTLVKKNEKPELVDGKFPNWRGVIPMEYDMKSFSLHLPFFNTILRTLRETVLISQETQSVKIRVPSEDGFDEMGFNVNLFMSLSSALLKLGIEEVEVLYSTPNRALIVVPKGTTIQSFSKDDTTFGLIMPVMLDHNSTRSTIEIPNATSLRVKVGETLYKTIGIQEFSKGESSSKSDTSFTKKPISVDAAREQAYKMGKRAARANKDRVPAQDQDLMNLVAKMDQKIGKSMTVYEQWINGWQDAKKSMKPKPVAKKPKADSGSSKKQFLRDKIFAFNMMETMEDDKDKVKFLKDKIEAFEIMLEF